MSRRTPALFGLVSICLCLAACGGGDDEEPSPSDFGQWELPPAPEVILPDPDADEVAIDPGPCAGLAEGASCDDGDACTAVATCQAGFCVGSEPIACALPPEAEGCSTVTCDPVQGCLVLPASDGESCDLVCHTAATCHQGACLPVAGSEVVCPPSEDACVANVSCDPSTGTCATSEFALACPVGFACRSTGPEGGAPKLECVESHTTLCRPCGSDPDCAEVTFPEHDNRCLYAGDSGSFCGADCSVHGCPEGYSCDATAVDPEGSGPPQCVRSDPGECVCKPAWAAMGLVTSCSVANASGVCNGQRGCAVQGLTDCDAQTPGPEVCDGLDNDCSGQADDGIPGGCGEPGACCLSEGGCSTLFEESCAEEGGDFSGVGLACAEVACDPESLGACCIPADGSCIDVGFAFCGIAGGVYQGDGITCSGLDCVAAGFKLGACCTFTGGCSQQSLAQCVAGSGSWAGKGVSCLAAACAPQGGCCTSDGVCKDATKVDCSGVSGYWSPGVPCGTSGCTVGGGKGACCSETGGCLVVDGASECAVAGQLFLSGEKCFGQCVSLLPGACCASDYSCLLTLADDCGADSEFHGPGSVCADECKAPVGACTLGDKCYPLTAADCAALGGDYGGEGTVCPP